MKKVILTSLSIVVGFALFVFVLWRTGVDNILNSLNLLSFGEFLIFVLFFFGVYCLHLYRWKLILKIEGYDIPFIRLIPPKTAGYAVSYLTPMARIGGEPIRAYLLQKEQGVGFGGGFGSVIIDKIIEWTATMIFLLTGMFLLFMYFTLPMKTGIYLLAMGAFLVFMLYLFYTKTMRNEGFFTMLFKLFKIDKIAKVRGLNHSVKEFEIGISSFFIKNKKRVLGLIVFSMFIQFLLLIMYMLLVSFLGFKISLLSALLIMVFVAFATVIPTPATLGAYEGSAAVAFILLGLGAGAGVAFILLIRLAELMMTGIGIFFLSFFGVKLSGALKGK